MKDHTILYFLGCFCVPLHSLILGDVANFGDYWVDSLNRSTAEWNFELVELTIQLVSIIIN